MRKLFFVLALCFIGTMGFAQNVEPSQSLTQPDTLALIPSMSQMETQPQVQSKFDGYVTHQEFQLTLSQMNNRYQQEMEKTNISGKYLAQAGRQFTGAFIVEMAGVFIGGILVYSNLNSGGVIIGVAGITSIVLTCCGFSNLKKSGLILQGTGVSYKF